MNFRFSGLPWGSPLSLHTDETHTSIIQLLRAGSNGLGVKKGRVTAILDGKALAEKVKQQLTDRIRALRQETGQVPGLAYLVVDDDLVSKRYVAGKTKACHEVGLRSFVFPLPQSIPLTSLLKQIDELNSRSEIHGILVQLPLPPHLDVQQVVEHIDPLKDADGFHPYNRGLLFSDHPSIAPCTPKGIMLLLKENGISPEGKRVVILGRSLVVGRPLLMLMLGENATVTVCHQKTRNLAEITRTAEILVAAIGRPKFITKDYVSRGAVVVDVGIHSVDGSLIGDVDFDEVSQVASYITPVPGGVGPMTVAMLLENTVHLFEKQISRNPARGRAL